MLKKLILSLVVGSCLLAATGNAQPCDGGAGGYLPLGYDYGALYRHMSANVPHFMAFPPVYYSEPVPRTYGYSPFAYPPHVRTPEIVAPVQPVTILNPYVEQTDAAEQADPDQTAQSHTVEPVVVLNPYVTTSRQVANR